MFSTTLRKSAHTSSSCHRVLFVSMKMVDKLRLSQMSILSLHERQAMHQHLGLLGKYRYVAFEYLQVLSCCFARALGRLSILEYTRHLLGLGSVVTTF